MRSLDFFLLWSVVAVGGCHGFLFSNAPDKTLVAFPGLEKVTQQQGQDHPILDIDLVVENPNDRQACMGLSGLQVQLSNQIYQEPIQKYKKKHNHSVSSPRQDHNLSFSRADAATRTATIAKASSSSSSTTSTISPSIQMPGANGDNPQLSSGKQELSIHHTPGFIGMNGFQKVNVDSDKGCWEMVWREGDMAGNLICGMTISQEAYRNGNGAVLPKGRIYASFLVWTPEEWDNHWECLEFAAKEAERYLQLYQHALEQTKTANWIEKFQLYSDAMSYAGKLKAAKRYFYFRLSLSPREEDMIRTSSGLYVLSKGTLWTTKEASTKSSEDSSWLSNLPSDGYQLLGKATITNIDDGANMILRP